MTWLLYRLILGDLLRIVGLTAAVLVTVIAFGATIKPLASDALLDAVQTAKYLGLAIVPMLQFALPFAAGFGATQALHRLTVDNEIQAMSLAGMSYRRILLPIGGLGIVLCLIMVLLTQWIIPRFWTLITQTIATDVTRVFQTSIRKGEAFQLGDVLIYAEDLIVQESPEGETGPQTRMFLLKVAAATLDDNGRVVTDVTANQAVADVYRRAGRTIIKLVMRDTAAFNPESGQLGGSAQAQRTIVVPNTLRDSPKAFTQGELLALRKNPDVFVQVASAREALIQGIREALDRAAIDNQLRSAHRVEFIGEPATEPGSSQPQPPRFIVIAARIKDGQFISSTDKSVEILQSEAGSLRRKFVASIARLRPAVADNSENAPAFNLELEDVKVTDLQQGGGPNLRATLTISGLHVAAPIEEDLDALSSDQLMALASTIHDGPERLAARIAKVQNEIDSLNREIISRLLNRYALSATAFLLLMLGAVLAIWLRNSLPLATYAWAFLPSIVNLILVSAGEQLLRDGQMLGHVVMWSGNAMMLVAILVVGIRVSRH